MTNTRRRTMLWLGALALFGLSFWAGRAGAVCNHYCFQFPNNNTDLCIYSGTSGQILRPQNCLLKVWILNAGSAGSCSGSSVCNVDYCVGSGTYCRAPSSGEYSRLGCGSCSGSTTMSGCQACM